MNVRWPQCAFVFIIILIGCQQEKSDDLNPEEAPNFIVIITDDQRFDALGVAQVKENRISRFPWFSLPTIDSLAATGAYFNNAYVTTSLCSPSRASILTGQYARTHGIRGNNDHFNLSSFASELQEYGYHTGYFGKWHMGEQQGQRPGFDHSYSFIGQGEYYDTDFEWNGELTSSTGWVDEVSADHLIFQLNHLPDEPFCFVLGTKSSHGPWDLAPEITEGYFLGDSILPVPNLSSFSLAVEESNMAAEITPRIIRQYFIYFRYLAAVDIQVRKILDTLVALDLSENTYLVFMSDNGFFMGEQRIPIDKRLAYEESIRIPFFINGPRVKPQVNESLVLNVDVCPTILDLAGVPNRLESQGKSLVPLLGQDLPEWRDHFVYEYYKESIGIQSDIFAVRDQRYKLIRYQQRPEWDELFDLQEDPYETTNLITEAAYGSIIEQLDKKLRESM